MPKKYDPARGGHAPGHLRDWFATLAEFGDPGDEMVEQGHDVRWLVGQLWNCTDTMPSLVCDCLDLPQGSSYAQGVRNLPDALLAA